MASIMRIWWADSRGKVVVVLLILWMAALIHEFQTNFITVPFLAIFLSVCLDLILGKLTRGHARFSLSSLVTGLLIGLIFDPTAGVGPIGVATLVASLSKHILKLPSSKHIFNPAAFGILIASFLFDRPVAWWGASWGFFPLLILSVGMLPALYQLRREWIPVTFLVVYFFNSSLRLTLDGTVFLFAFVMLPEPITSVGRGLWRYGWGILVGVIVAVLGFFRFAAADPLLTALLLANIVTYTLIR